VTEWTEEEIETLKKEYQNTTSTKIGIVLGKTTQEIRYKIRRLGLVKISKWSEEEIDLLKKVYSDKTISQLKELFPTHSKEDITSTSRKFDLRKTEKPSKYTRWSEEDELFLKENWENMGRSELATKINKSVDLIFIRARELNLKINEKLSANGKTEKWSDKEIQFLKENYEKLGISETAKILNRSDCATKQKASQLDLIIKIEFPWTDEEREIVRKNYSFSTQKELEALVPNRTYTAIKAVAHGFDLEKDDSVAYIGFWTEEDKNKLQELVDLELTDGQIGEKLNRTAWAVKVKRRLLGIVKRTLEVWTDEEDNILRNMYATTKIEEIINLIPHKNIRIVWSRAKKLGLSQNPSLLWPPEETEILIREYPNKMCDELQLLFQNKTKTQIKDKAKTLGLRKTPEILLKCFGGNIHRIPELLDKNNKWRTKVLKRDDFTCQECGFRDGTGIELQAHHIIPQRDPDCNPNDVNNGICLCDICHYDTYNKEYLLIQKYTAIVQNAINKTSSEVIK